MPFDFAYSVNEDGNDYSHNAISDGDVTRGEYRVALPDGRTQIVKYTADWKNGFNAEVWTLFVLDYDEVFIFDADVCIDLPAVTKSFIKTLQPKKKICFTLADFKDWTIYIYN